MAKSNRQKYVASQCNGQALDLESRAYLARIQALVQSNEAKIKRIQEFRIERDLLLSEKDAFLAEIDILHRINRNVCIAYSLHVHFT